MQETRNSANQFLPDVYHFELPEAFRDPVFRPSRTCHVVFDREVFQRVRDEDLGTVRGQPIRPVLAGFGEPVTDWLFQSALEARPGESAFCLRTGGDWPHGEGWLLVYSLRWLGSARRLAAPDSVAAVFSGPDGPVLLKETDLVWLAAQAEPLGAAAANLPPPDLDAARRVAQRRLRELVERREPAARSSAGMSLWLAAAVENAPGGRPSQAAETAAGL